MGCEELMMEKEEETQEFLVCNLSGGKRVR